MDTNDNIDLDAMTDDQLIDIVYGTLETLCNELESRGFDPEIIDASMFIFWQQRMFESGDREGFEAVIEDALDEEWPLGPTIH